MYSRLVKEAIDLISSSQSEENTASKDAIVTEEPVLQVLAINSDECGNILEQVTSLLDFTWVWLAKVLDVVEGQLQHGEGFDTKVIFRTVTQYCVILIYCVTSTFWVGRHIASKAVIDRLLEKAYSVIANIVHSVLAWVQTLEL